MATIVTRSGKGALLDKTDHDNNMNNLNDDKLDKVDTTAQSVESAVTFNKGVAFPATQVPSADVNTLDDYEEGTFTPTVWDALSGGNEADGYTTQEGIYTKIGNVVYVGIAVKLTGVTAMTGANDIHIRGLPFTHRTTEDGDFALLPMTENGIGGNSPAGALLSNSTVVKVYNNASTSTIAFHTVSDITDLGVWRLQGHYFV